MPIVNRTRTRIRGLLEGAPGWVGGVLTGVQGAALSLLVVLAPAFAATASAPTQNGSAAIDWAATSALSVRLWLLAHGVPLVSGGVTFTLAPLGLTLISFAILVALARRFCTKAWGSWAIATGTYAGLVAIATTVATASEPSGGSATVKAALVAALIAGPAVAAGIWRAHGAAFGWVPRVPQVVRAGLRLGLGTVALMASAAAVVGAGFAIAGRDAIAAATTALGIDPLGGVALAFGEALYTPNIAVWTLGWMTGQGFAVGEGSLYSPGVITADAMPGFPVLGALPAVAGGLFVWAPAVLVLLAVVARLAMGRRVGLAWADLRVLAAALAVVGGAVAVIGAAASGAIGPGRLAVAGIDVVAVVASCVGLSALGFLLGHGLALAGSRVFPARTPTLTVVRDDEDVTVSS
jgi:hypothetical protein